MIKKYRRLSAIFVALSASLVLGSSASFAGIANYKGEPAPCPIKVLPGGLYIGAGANYDRYQYSNSFNSSDVIFGDTTHFSNRLSGSGWSGDLNLGYGYYWCQLYLGVEVHGVLSDAESSSNFSHTDEDGDVFSGNVNVKSRGSWGVSVLPGYKVNESTLVYIRLGYVDTQFRTHANFSIVDPDDAFTFSRSRSRTRWRSGFLGGVGIETYVWDNVSLRGEYQYTAYSNVNHTFTSDDTTFHTRVRPSNSSFTLGLAYHFCL